PQPQPTGLWHPTPAQAQAYAAGAAAQYGWTGQQWRDLVTLWNHESSWSWSAQNPTSPAYGIPQANPGSNMSLFGANWRDDASVQIAWGLNYIKGRYGSPSAAWAYWQRIGWY
ncbi:MAG: G5 domain-containing protein, partial [Bifidobacterium mongoliense]